MSERASAWRRAAGRRPVSRTALAAALVGLALAALVGGWLVTGWRAASGEARALAAAPRRAAAERAAQLAAALGARLEVLRAEESERPYHEYQNLHHDPRGASRGTSVVPSPLARGPEDPLVALHFQIDPAGRFSAPTVNEELPHLSDPARGEADRRALAALGEALAHLGPELVAAAAATGARAQGQAEEQALAQAQAPVQVQQIGPAAYAQNAMPNAVYQDLTRPDDGGRKLGALTGRGVVEIRIGALTWRTATVEGSERLVALRTVETPDGRLTQGLSLSPAALADWLAERSPDLPARLLAGPPPAPPLAAAPLQAGAATWHVAVDPGAAQAGAVERGAAVRRGFLLQVAPAAILALLCGGLVILLVARAERLARQRSDFAAAAAHELRTPLAGLVLYGDMLADGLGDPARRADYARRVSEEAARLGRVVGNVLGFTQLERRQLAVSARPGDAAACARDAAERARPALEHAGARLETAIAPAAPARLDGDAVARILQNLLDNAEKYARGAEDRTILLTVEPAPGGGARIEVADRGPGIPAGLRRRLFTPFTRAADPDGPAGLGLGLALASALAGAMGGTLTHHDREGGGTRFTLDLPPP